MNNTTAISPVHKQASPPSVNRLLNATPLHWAVVASALLLKLILVATSVPHFDDAYYINIAQNYILRGELTPYMWRLGADTNIIAGSGTGYGIILLSEWMRWFGLSLGSGRALMYLLGLLTLALLYGFVRTTLEDQRTAAFVLMFTALNVTFFYIIPVRMDAPGILAHATVLWFHFYAWQQSRHWLHALVGVAAIATTELHILGIVYVGGYALYYAYQQVVVWLQERRFRLLAPTIYYYVGAFVAGCVYLWVHVLPDPQAYFIIPQSCDICVPRGPITEFERFTEYAVRAPLETTLLVMAVISFIRRPNPVRTHLVTLLFGFIIAFFIVNPPVSFPYTSHLYPIVSVIVGLFLAQTRKPLAPLERSVWIPVVSLLLCIELAVLPGIWLLLGITVSFLLVEFFIVRRVKVANRILSNLTLLFVVALLIARVGDTATGRARNGFLPHHPVNTAVTNYIYTHVPTDAVVMASPTAYLDLIPYSNFLTYRDGEQYGMTLRGETHSEFLQRHQPVIILGSRAEHFGNNVVDDPVLQTYIESAGGFTEVTDDLWVSDAYIAAQSLPNRTN